MKMRTILTAAFIPCVLIASKAMADRPAKEELRETVPVREQPAVNPQPVPAADTCGNMRLSYGQTVWFFDDEHNTTAPGVYFDYWCSDVPLNFRVGVEGRHMDIYQKGTEIFQESPGATVQVTYIRIPFAVEYYYGLSEDLTWYAGLGPEIINLVNDVSDTAVGLHIGTRLHYAITENFGAAVEGGYMWDYLEDQDQDVDLNGFYVTPQLSYTF